VLNAQGLGTYSDVAAAIVRATDEGAQVINMSLGGANPSSILNDAIDYAIDHEVMVVAAAGNTGGAVLYPAAYEPVIAVGSVDPDERSVAHRSVGGHDHPGPHPLERVERRKPRCDTGIRVGRYERVVHHDVAREQDVVLFHEERRVSARAEAVNDIETPRSS
jgi:hypothetical protein